ncbi:MAG: fumarylacetoacetate hydrolase family protein [Proteobacteria bacterium]|nr:fumarylacetoacetate hydrolase family protein [Pseudomonadota bacterium]
MKIATIDTQSGGHVGVLVDADTILDVTAFAAVSPTARLVPGSVRSVLDAGDAGLELVKRCADEAAGSADQDSLSAQGILRPFAETPLLAPIPDPRFILSVGMNYGRHLEEMSGTPTPTHPAAFIKIQDSLTGSGKPITVPPQCPDMIDYEGELCFVFGKSCHNVEAEGAMDYIAGYTIANDVSARDWTPEVFGSNSSFGGIHAWERNIMGKQLPGFTPLGPVMVTKDEIADPHDLQLTTTLNGEVMQSTKTDDLIFKLPEIIAYFSKWYRFHPGDVVTTGSPAGVGLGRKPPVFMKAGDRIEIEIEGIGKLSNMLVAA